MSTLSREDREVLLRRARKARERLPASSLRQAATALAILQRDGLEALDEAMDEGTDVLLGANAEHWDVFRRAMRHDVREVADRYGVVGAGYFLGWVKRFGSMKHAAAKADRGRKVGRPEAPRPRRPR